MKEKLIALYFDSMVYQIYRWFAETFLPETMAAVRQSFAAEIYWFIRYKIVDRILNYKYVQLFINPKVFAEEWYNSFFYKANTYRIRRLAYRIPKAGIAYRSIYLGIFLACLLLVPKGIWADTYLIAPFLCLAILFLSHHAIWRTGTIFVMVNLILFFFLGLLALAAPYAAFRGLAYLLLAIDFFFLMSFGIKNRQELQNILLCVYFVLFVLCAVTFVKSQNSVLPARATLASNTEFAEILILLFPFAFTFPFGMKSGIRRAVYMVLLMFLTFTAVTATQSKAALIGFSVELLLIILFTDKRYLFILIFLMPALTTTAVNNIIGMWTSHATHGNFFENIYHAFRDFWSTGFGVNSNAFMSVYQSTADRASDIRLLPNVQISPLYFSFLLDMGAIVFLGFLYYILKLAHSALTSLVMAPKEYKPYFAAGLATLIGISVSSMFDATLLSPRSMMTYWGMLGILRAVRIIYLGILDT